MNMTKQLTLFPEITKTNPADLTRRQFSHGDVCPQPARIALEKRYRPLLEQTDEFNRKIVSFQANKTEVLHSWFKYREGFSATLVDILLQKFGYTQDDTVFDPFAGSGTTLLVAQMLGINATGIELLPHSYLAWQAKSKTFVYAVDELCEIRDLLKCTAPPETEQKFHHIKITATAFPEATEKELMAYTHWFDSLDVSPNAKTLCRLILTSILEDISYTRKDGQYLRWDAHAGKVQARNAKRIAQGKAPTNGINKGELPGVKQATLAALDKIINDIRWLQQESAPQSHQNLISGNSLYILPSMLPAQFSGVITSPPYANRYDYTRTYALELAYANVGDDIFKLRQRQLSCTVENKSKLAALAAYYQSIEQSIRYNTILQIVNQNQALREINTALEKRNQRGEINNKGVLRMIAQYFTELTFVFAELYRVCKKGAHVVVVNDNVRYAGEIIPVDLLSTNLAEEVGFTPVKIYTLPQRKGNSSQQMKKFGREALRKSITVWQKA